MLKVPSDINAVGGSHIKQTFVSQWRIKAHHEPTSLAPPWPTLIHSTERIKLNPHAYLLSSKPKNKTTSSGVANDAVGENKRHCHTLLLQYDGGL